MAVTASITRLVGFWFLVGACMKLFYGTPADLPRIAQDLSLRAALLFKLAIGIEIVVGTLALLRPSRGWLPALPLLLVFLLVLVLQISGGEQACGCFGTALTITPEIMLSIDGTLLLLLLVSRPWRLRKGLQETPWIAVTVVALVGVTLTATIERESRSPGEVGGLRKFVDLDVNRWKGKRLSQTSLYPWLTREQRIEKGVIVIWRASCEICANHLSRLAAEEQGDRDVVLLELPMEFDDEQIVVEALPEGGWVQEAQFSKNYDWFVTPPAHIEVSGGRVVVAKEGMDVLEDR